MSSSDQRNPPTDRSITLGRALRALRQYGAATLTDVAGQVGVSPSYLSMVERGTRNPSAETLERIQAVLHQRINKLGM